MRPRRISRVALLLFLTECVALRAMPTPGQARSSEERSSIQGQVVKATTGEPVTKAQVHLTKLDRDRQSFGATTDASGHFLITDIEPGRYNLFVERNGYLNQTYGQRSSMAGGGILSLDNGRQIRDLLFRLVPTAVITGRVLDEDGDPIPYAHVQALRYQYADGRRRIAPINGASSNDLGEYRIFGLAPGRYYLTAIPTQYRPAAGSPAVNSAEQGYAPTYFPGTIDPTKAAQLELHAGEEASRIDFTLRPTRTVRVRGRILNPPTGESGRGAMVALLPKGSDVSAISRNQAAMNADGSFEIRHVRPGSYLLIGQSFEGAKRSSASVPLEVGSSDVEGIRMILGPGIDLPGQVRIDGQAGLPTNLHLYLRLRSAEGLDYRPAEGTEVKEDGSFLVQSLGDDTYRLSIDRLPPNYYLKSVRLGGGDVSEEEINLGGGKTLALEILLSAEGGRVDGVVVREDNQPFGGAQVVLVPEKSRRNHSTLFKTSTSDQYGRFLMQGIAPGAYKLFAWEEIEPGAYLDPDFLTPYEGLGKTVEPGQNSTQTVELKLIPAPKGGP